ncbi:hypothetical protein [Anaerotignum propionicum]|uniref:hypothetical protein n=1 Tax=Anaerotignum propionicum TaxID=28446 RepID=UPI00210AD811|nr:hypothetical protein [Anaerotignum propionicum]MCQ4936199.1 hypothetical protein [Anaerotignum propionicum]
MASIFEMVFFGSASSVNTAMEQKKESIKNIGLWGFILAYNMELSNIYLFLEGLLWTNKGRG